MRDVQAERGTGFERCLTARGVTAFLTGEWLGQDRQVITLGIVQRDGGHRFLGHGEPRAADVARECGASVRSGASERTPKPSQTKTPPEQSVSELLAH
jgi:hypothetical protein